MLSIDPITLVVFVAAILGGIATGLLPGLPAWLAPFLLTPFVAQVDINHIILFWLVTVIGSQYFSSIASIMFGIPGENSSLIYINDIRKLNIDDRANLVKKTANASLFASVTAIIMVAIFHKAFVSIMPVLGTTMVKFSILWMITIMVIVISSNKVWVSAMLFLIGVLLVPKSNIALPAFFAQANQFTYDLTLINLVIGTMILPSIFQSNTISYEPHTNQTVNKPSNDLRSTITGTIYGLFFGFVPGPTATMSAAAAYKFTRGNIIEKIISAEAANNSVIIIGGFLLLYLQIPMALDAVAVFAVLNARGWDIYDDFIMTGSVNDLFAWLTLGSIIIWALARKSNKFYRWICVKMNDTALFVIAIIISLIMLDLFSGSGSYNIGSYLIWLSVLSTFGVIIGNIRVSPLPLVFGFMFGDHIVWASYQILTSL